MSNGMYCGIFIESLKIMQMFYIPNGLLIQFISIQRETYARRAFSSRMKFVTY